MERRPALISSWSSAITNRAGPDFRRSRPLLFMDHAPLITWQQRHLGYDQGTSAGLAGNRKMPTNQLDSLMHFAQPNVFTKARLVEDCQWLEATATILHLQVDLRSLALERQACRRCARVLTHIGERLLGHPEESCFNGGREAFWPQRLIVADRPALVAQRLSLQAQRRCQPEVV